jgi:hypothetical protein
MVSGGCMEDGIDIGKVEAPERLRDDRRIFE